MSSQFATSLQHTSPNLPAGCLKDLFKFQNMVRGEGVQIFWVIMVIYAEIIILLTLMGRP